MISPSEQDALDTLVLVGSGAVELNDVGIAHFDNLASENTTQTTLGDFKGRSDTWRVFFHAVARVFPNLFGKDFWAHTCTPVENHYDQFKIEYYNTKSTLNNCINRIRAATVNEKDLAHKVEAVSRYIPKLRHEIADEFRTVHQLKNQEKSQNSGIILRTAGIVASVESFMTDKSLFVTTNWDHSIENYLNDHGIVFSTEHLLHIHGSFLEPELLFLPMDTTFEDWILFNALSPAKAPNSTVEKFLSDLLKLPRHPCNVEILALRKGKIYSRSWKRIIIWGLAFFSEDLVLSALVQEMIDELRNQQEYPEVTIINPSEPDRNRIARLLKIPPSKRIDIDPVKQSKTTF